MLVLINGAPGSGKSTMAAMIAAQRPRTLALDIDTIKQSIDGWDQDLQASGLRARRIAIDLIRRELAAGHDVILGQYLARPELPEQLADVAREAGAEFLELALVVDARFLGRRLAQRRHSPDRPEQRQNDRFVRPDDADDLVASIAAVLSVRPGTARVDASGAEEETAAQVLELLNARSEFAHWRVLHGRAERCFAGALAVVKDPGAATPATAWSAAEVTDHVREEHSADGAVEDPVELSMLTLDLTVHAWDLARSQDMELDVDEELSRALHEAFAPYTDLMAKEGEFRPPVPVEDTAGSLERLIGLCGRDPSWTGQTSR